LALSLSDRGGERGSSDGSYDDTAPPKNAKINQDFVAGKVKQWLQ
jgi:hypothetical protein